MVISAPVGDHNSHPYNKIGMQKEEYSLNDVEGCRQPNLDPTAKKAVFSLKNTVLGELCCVALSFCCVVLPCLSF